MKKIEDPEFVVDSNGTLIVAIGAGSPDDVTIQSENREYVEMAKMAATAGTSVEVIHLAQPFVAGWTSNLGILTALLAVNPGRTSIIKAPEDALAEINRIAFPAGSDPNVVY